MRRYDVVTFDCYGTLIDWERGIGDAVAAAAAADGVRLDRAAVLAAYHAIEPVVEAERYRPYREVLALTARRVAERLGWRLAAGAERFLPESLPAWPPFPDTNDALRRLADAGYRLAILSNVDDDLLAMGCVYPRIEEVRKASTAVARAVCRRAAEEGVAGEEGAGERVEQAMWVPRYLAYRPA